MNTPICDFVRTYAESGSLRLHMPGHKGVPLLGFESYDITEISGADSLYEADGIIAESEKNASKLFGCPTFYSTEGSSQCIRAMLHLICTNVKKNSRKPVIAAGRNAHKTFISACALIDFDVIWLTSPGTSYLSCALDRDAAERLFDDPETAPDAVYLTSPDYLGNCADIASVAEVCHRHGALLAVDNAHGAYLGFLSPSRHPIALGADICCDSAHKTLPALTGGAYLHIAEKHGDMISHAKSALSLYGSTSPSYLILQSLDAANAYIADGYREKLADFSAEADLLREGLCDLGYTLIPAELLNPEPLKITISAKEYGYTGYALAGYLEEKGLIPEFADPDFLVLMLTPENKGQCAKILDVFAGIEKKVPIPHHPPQFVLPEKAMPVREAVFSKSEVLPVSRCIGRILAAVSVGCPPAVPIVVSGERIDEKSVECFRYYGIAECPVVAE